MFSFMSFLQKLCCMVSFNTHLTQWRQGKLSQEHRLYSELVMVPGILTFFLNVSVKMKSTLQHVIDWGQLHDVGTVGKWVGIKPRNEMCSSRLSWWSLKCWLSGMPGDDPLRPWDIVPPNMLRMTSILSKFTGCF